MTFDVEASALKKVGTRFVIGSMMAATGSFSGGLLAVAAAVLSTGIIALKIGNQPDGPAGRAA
jgi:hypothetical protein